jgi:hypothetical protein
VHRYHQLSRADGWGRGQYIHNRHRVYLLSERNDSVDPHFRFVFGDNFEQHGRSNRYVRCNDRNRIEVGVNHSYGDNNVLAYVPQLYTGKTHS